MPEEEKKKTKSGASGGNRGLMIMIPLVILAGVGIWYWSNRGSEGATGGTARMRSTLHLETFVLNLADADQRSYLRVGIELGLNHEATHDEVQPVAQARDVILGVLAEAKVSDLTTAEGKKKLKDDVLRALQERVPQLGVEAVYFTEFLIQR
jgi:flagellar basal body-associated protein FliL